MIRIAVLSSALFLAHTGCVANQLSVNCSVEGAGFLPGNLDSASACQLFRQRLDAALSKSDLDLGTKGYSVAIVIDKRGSLQARLAENGSDSNTKNYPVARIDVMDRPLEQDDLGRLADAIADVLAAR